MHGSPLHTKHFDYLYMLIILDWQIIQIGIS